MKFRPFAWGVLGVNLFVILWGALVRATGSGAGCGRHWPLCNGEVIPTAPATATLIELTHRITSGLALLLVAALFWWSRREFPRGHAVRRWAACSLGFIVIEAGIGAGLVLLELVGANSSLARAGYLAAHLLNTFLLLGALTLTIQPSAPRIPPPASRRPTATGWLVTGLALLLVVGISGGIAALGDTLFPAGSLREGFRADLDPNSHVLLRLRGWHPLFALVAAVYLGLLTWRLARGSSALKHSGWTRAVPAVLVLQLGAGLLNLVLLAPVALQLGHLLLADLLWISVVGFSATVLSAAEG